LSQFGERRDDGTRITLSLATDERRRQTERVLWLLGWKLSQRDSSVTVEPGDQPEDGQRQERENDLVHGRLAQPHRHDDVQEGAVDFDDARAQFVD